MQGKYLIDLVIAIALFFIAVSDFYKGILMVFKDRHPLLFVVQIWFMLLKLLPESARRERYEKAMSVYIKRQRIYGLFALIGAPFVLLLSISAFYSL